MKTSFKRSDRRRKRINNEEISMKKFFATLAVTALIITAIIGGTEVSFSKADETSLKDIEVYLIAGQSNAVGYTQVDSAEEQAEIDKDPRIASGFQNVKYYGYVECNKDSAIPVDIPFRTVKLGKGAESTGKTRELKNNTFGPEMGMARYFTDNGVAGKEYGIIKYAAGGTAIYDEINSSTGSQYGNWMSPSLIAKYGKTSSSLTGLCYNNFLKVVKQGVEAYKANGYNPIIKGIAWMQGESESQSAGKSKIYAELLSTMISDMRKDISIIASQNLSELTVVVAKIPSKYKTVVESAKYVDVVRAQMDQVAENDADVLLIDNDFVTLPGTDNHHYNVPDMLKVGENFAEKFIEAVSGALPKIKVEVVGGGKSDLISRRATPKTNIAVTLTPDTGYEFDSYEFLNAEGGKEDVTRIKVGNVVRFEMPDKDVILKVVFSLIPKFNVTASCENGEIYRTNAQRLPYRGESVTFTFKPEKGYKLDKVIVNGVEVNADTSYEYPVYTLEVKEDINVSATFVKAQQDEKPNPDPTPSPSEKRGCKAATADISLIAVAMFAIAKLFIKK